MAGFWKEDRFGPVFSKQFGTRAASLQNTARYPGYSPRNTPLGGAVRGIDHIQDLKDMYDFYPRTGHQMRNSDIYDQIPRGAQVNVRVFNLGKPNETTEYTVGGAMPGMWSSDNPPYTNNVTGTNSNLTSMPSNVITKKPDGQLQTIPVINVTTQALPPQQVQEEPNSIDREPRHLTHEGELPADSRFDSHYPKENGGWDPKSLA